MKLAGALLAIASAVTTVRATGLADGGCSYAPPPTPPPTTPAPSPVDCELYSALTDPSPWGPCKQKGDTNKYYRTKVLGIKTEPQNGGKPCPSETDPARNPEDLCAPLDCVPFTQAEDNLPWGDCTNDGTGKFVKTRVHGIKVPPQNGGNCDVEKRTDREVCPAENCVPFSKEEDQGEYSKCFLQAGKYIKTKTLGVKTPEKNGGTCDPKDRLVEEPCAAIDCVLKTRAEDDGPFSNCTDFFNNGTYYRSKVLGIKVQPENGGAACPAETDLARIALDFCPPVDCVAVPKDEDTGEFGECFARNGTNSWIRTKILGIKTPPQNGGKCDPKDRTIEEVCPPVNCVVFNATEDPGEFGPCVEGPQQSNVPRYIKTKTLGIKTPAKYGGTCPSEDDPVRYYEEVCPPINCVPLGNDTGTFGNCTDDDGDGKWYRSKVLGIKEPAQNGGTCDPKDRTVYEYCQPVDCTRFTEAEDNGPYGNCTLVGYGSYARNKTLGIKTPALYGGACPPVVVEKDCPNDGYCVPWDPNYDECLTSLAKCGKKRSDWFYKTNVISVTEGLALWQCCGKCTNTAGCAGYSYDSSQSKCSLVWNADAWQVVNGMVSSEPVNPKPANCRYFDGATLFAPNAVITDIVTDDLDVCCSSCKADSRCKSFTLSSSESLCQLFSVEGNKTDGWPDMRGGWPLLA